MIAETEQWQLDGDCEKCRKDSYCTKACTARMKMIGGKVSDLFSRAFNKAVEKKKAELENKIEEGEYKNENEIIDTNIANTNDVNSMQP